MAKNFISLTEYLSILASFRPDGLDEPVKVVRPIVA